MVQLGSVTNLVVCQKSKLDDWINHFKTHYSNINVYDLTDKKQLHEFIMHDVAWNGYRGGLMTIGVINYDILFRRPDLLELKPFTLMLDESSLIQNEKAKRTKFVLKMNPENIILLSGTPTSGKYENLWTQLHLLGWEISQDTYNKQYVNWKKIDVGGFIHKIVDKEDPYKNIDRLKSKLREHGAVFMKTEECFDLPEQTFIPVTLKTTKEYKKFKRDSVISIDTITCKEHKPTCTNPWVELVGDTTLSRMLYLRMLCGHYNQDKLDAFRDLVESTNDRLIVFYNFKEEARKMIQIVNELERPWAIISGDVKNLAAYENYDDSITFVQYQAGSMGLNLQKANKIIYFTPTCSCEQWMQSQKRIHRIGQNKTCFYYQMMCEGSIEEDIYKTLERGVDYTNELFTE